MSVKRSEKLRKEVVETKRIQKLLEEALLRNGKMVYALYEWELQEQEAFQKASMTKDKDDFIFSVTENNGHVAMVLIEKSGRVHINEQARDWLKALWPDTYESNMKLFIPGFAKQLSRKELPLTGVKIAHDINAGWGRNQRRKW